MQFECVCECESVCVASLGRDRPRSCGIPNVGFFCLWSVAGVRALSLGELPAVRLCLIVRSFNFTSTLIFSLGLV
jgi:hypothetical protein